MILLYNVYITNEIPKINGHQVSTKKNRGNLSTPDNLDTFKYTIASISKAYDWKRVIIYIDLEESYAPRKDELESFIKNEFKGKDLILRWKRNMYQNDWKDTYELLNDRIIYFCCNHDHVFMDSSYDYFHKLIDYMRNEEEYCTIPFSHWPENIRNLHLDGDPGIRAKNGEITPPYDSKSMKIEEDFISVIHHPFDSIQIITKELYKNWWFVGEFNEYKLPRPDYFGISLSEIKTVPLHKSYIPYKELHRHFDAYPHVGIPNNKCPCIDIPKGFFENNILISYGMIMNDSVNINPLEDILYIDDVTKPDYNFTLDDIPLFWKSRIKSICFSWKLNDIEEELIQHRLKHVLNMIYYQGYPIKDEVRDRILDRYLKTYKGYTI